MIRLSHALWSPIARSAAAVASLALLREPKNLDAPFVPTGQDIVDRMLAMAGLTADSMVIDLGCGDGRILTTAAQRYGCRGLGVDLDRRRILEARTRAQTAGVSDRVRFERMDLFACDLRPADVVTVYLFPDVNFRLQPQFFRQLRPGALVLSHDFDMGEWRPDAITRNPSDLSPVRLWRMPAWVGGVWQGHLGGAPLTMALSQSYQRCDGAAPAKGYLVRDGLLDGQTLRAIVDPTDGPPLALAAVVAGDTLSGRIGDVPFTARRTHREPIHLSHARTVLPSPA
jgi:SAM-dependent methyltransferase